MSMILGSISIGENGVSSICRGTLGVCNTCFAPACVAKCSKCHIVRYCTRECQKADWKTHKSLCRLLCDIPDEWGHITQDEDEVCTFPCSEEANTLADQAFEMFEAEADFGDFVKNEKGMKLLLDAASAGHKNAQFLASMCSFQQGNEAEGVRWIKEAAHNNHARAQLVYGFDYLLQGKRGHTVNEVQSVLWLRRALSHGASETHDKFQGDHLARKDFESALTTVTRTARKIFLSDTYLDYMSGSKDDDTLKLCADCGIVPAINLVSGSTI